MYNRKINTGPTFWFSVLLIILGALLLFDNLRIFDIEWVWDYWPLLLIGIGFYRFYNSGYKDIYSSGMFVIIGLILLLVKTDVIYFRDIWQFWPLILIFIGGRIIYNKVILDEEARDKKATISDDRIDHVAIFGGKEKKVTSNNFQGGNITAIFGGVDLYLGNAKLSDGDNVLDILVMFGGVDIYVPGDWKIITKGFPIFGGFTDNRKNPPDAESTTNNVLVIKGLVLFGGLEIKDA
jgi:predicted membrane protein